MDTTNITLSDALEMALKAEKKAYQFYHDAVKETTIQHVKDLLERLASFELYHYDILNSLKKSLNESGEYFEYDKSKAESFEFCSPIELDGKLDKSIKNELEIIALAIKAETNAYNHYKKMGELTTDPKGKKMFKQLEKEELSHRRILSDEFYQLSELNNHWF